MLISVHNIESESISSVIYDSVAQKLHVSFVNGHAYFYSGVPLIVIVSWLNADSFGSYYNEFIKWLYDFIRIA